ncbi:MAG TPA: maleylpyruvate isomerase family mycothiol-dependent enzyme [Pseudonocardia sp.]
MDHAAALVEENRLLATLAATADLDTPVPTCPGWSLRQLFRHVGRGDRWAATIVRTGQPANPREVADGKPPEGELVGWLHGGPVAVIEAVSEVGPDQPVWTFAGAKPASWWIPRRMGEALVHRADAAFAMGQEYAVDAERAAAGVSEWLGVLQLRAEEAVPPLPEGATLHLHATDDGLGPVGEWLVRGSGGRVTWQHGHAKGDVAVRGSAGDLLLALTRRRPSDSVETIGDAAVWQRWLATTDF